MNTKNYIIFLIILIIIGLTSFTITYNLIDGNEIRSIIKEEAYKNGKRNC